MEIFLLQKKEYFADEIGISRSTLAKMSNGREVSMSILGKICEKYNCDFGEIVTYVREVEEK